MRTRTHLFHVVPVLFAVACGGSGGSSNPTLRIDSIEPNCVMGSTAPTPVKVTGNMPVSTVVDINNPGSSHVNSTYQAWVNGEALTSVTRVDSNTLTASVPAMLAGTYPLLVQGPVGNPVNKDKFFKVSTTPCNASLAITTATAAPATVMVGDTVTVSATVQNTGLTTADSVTVAIPSAPAGLTAATSAAPQSVAAGDSKTFSFTYKASAVGSGTFALDASGTASDTHQAVIAPSVNTNAILVNPSSLLSVNTTVSSASGTSQAASVSDGEPFQITLMLTNQATTPVNVTPAMTASGVAQSLTSAPSPVSVPAGGTQSFVWAYTAVAPGTSTYVASATATAASGPPVTVQTAPLIVTVQAGASLATAVKVAPSPVPGGANDQTTVTATVTNSGGATAKNVTASIASAPTGVTPPSAPPGPQDILGGTSATFTWTYTVGASPGGTFSVTAQGTDANSGAAVAAPAATGPLVVTYPVGVAVTGLTGTGLVVSDGTDSLPLTGNNTFAFPTQLPSGSQLAVTITSQPTNQTCTVSAPVQIGVAPVNAAVTCTSGTPTTQTCGLVVTMSGTGSGAVSCSPGPCNQPYTCGTTVTLTEQPVAPSVFSGWGGACSTTPATSSTCSTVVNSANVAVTAGFAIPANDALNITVNDSGESGSTVQYAYLYAGGLGTTGTCPTQCSPSVPGGTTVTLTANPAAGAKFSGWGGACSGTGTCNVTMNASSVSVTATFTTTATPDAGSPDGG